MLSEVEIDLETLNPIMQKFSSFSSYIPRRIHLDSSSYRSLVCIISHCVDFSLVPSLSAPERIISVRDPISSQGKGELHQDHEAGANIDWGNSDERQENDRLTGDAAAGVSAAHADLLGLDLSDFEEKEIEVFVNREELRSVMLECCRLIDGPNEEGSGESHVGNEQAGHEVIAHFESEIARAVVHGEEEVFSRIEKVLEVVKEYGRVPDSSNKAEDMRKTTDDVGDIVSTGPVVGADYDKAILVEKHDKNFKEVEEIGEGTKQQTNVHSISFVDYSGLRNWEEDQVCTLTNQTDRAEMEEGEISDDAQDIQDLDDFNDNEKVSEDQRMEGPSRDDYNEVAFTTICIHKKELTELGAGPLDTSDENSLDKANQNSRKVVKERENKKNHRALTEERKAKKKIAKKRKRAQKNREQGVKKLKLHAIVKPKKVKYCNFYGMGRCQQGDLCKFSHDTTPLTKSIPCKYFACNSCLKGDDCPYDHELSKYPCHAYMSTGCCNRADRCMFFHKIPDADASSQLTVSKLDLCLTSEQSKLRNQPVGTRASPLDIGSSEGKTKDTLPLRHRPLKEATQVPKGIRFISLGTVQKDLTNKVNEILPLNKSCHTGAYNHNKQDNLLVHSHHSALALSRNSEASKKSIKSSVLVGNASFGFSVKDSGNIIKGSPITHPVGTANLEVSEATKILEEFLFCGAD